MDRVAKGSAQRAAKLSVNVNKVATLRNSRGGQVPHVLDAVDVCVKAGAPGITVHPRADQRHITTADVRDIAKVVRGSTPAVEFNIEGDPRPDLLALVDEVRPDQCTLVPVVPGEITSQAGWQPGPATESMAATIARLHDRGIRVMAMITNVRDARAVVDAGVDFVVAQGTEAGGHRASFVDRPGLPLYGLLPLLSLPTQPSLVVLLAY